jgi:PIN domain nuclease of toxin-antitoxin system
MLTRRQRLILAQPITSWQQRALELGIAEIPVSGDIGILSTELEDFPADPADRIITASAVIYGATLITADTSILGWQGHLHRHDAHS